MIDFNFNFNNKNTLKAVKKFTKESDFQLLHLSVLREYLQIEFAYQHGLDDAVNAGYNVLQQGGSAVNAVKAAIVVLEDNILFNAGRGSVFTKKGVQEMDAAIMDGRNREAGSVAAVRNIRNPIELATAVMQKSDLVFLSGEGANDFAIRAV